MKIRLTEDERFPTLYEVNQMGDEFDLPDHVVQRWKDAKKAFEQAEKVMFKAMGWDRYVD